MLSRRCMRLILLGLLMTCGGCQGLVEFDARKLVEPASMPGRAMLHAVGTNQELVQANRITSFGQVQSADGIALAYWLIKHRHASPATTVPGQARGTVVLIHPLLTSKAWFLPLGERLADEGFDVVLVDLRAHGDSGGNYVTWGAKEKTDVKAVVDHLVATREVPARIYAVGASLGGCVAVQYAAIDPRCCGVLSICPPTSATDVARLMLPWCLEDDLQARVRCAGKLAGFDPREASAVDAAAKLKCPLLLVHGSLDLIVPFHHSELIYQAAPEPKRLIPVYWADHMTVQIGRYEWFVEQIEELAAMGVG